MRKKVKLKTKEQLLKEGWEENPRSIYYFLSMDGKKPPERQKNRYDSYPQEQRYYLHKHFVENQLGQEVVITGAYEEHGRSYLTMELSYISPWQQGRTSTIRILPEIVASKTKIEPPKALNYGELGAKSRRNFMFVDGRFTYGCESMTKAEAKKVARWILKVAK